MYAGFIGALPVIMYQVYKFIMPMMPNANTRKILGFTAASFALAVCGVVFAYVVSLPASLYFLTNFNLHSINPMLTIDSYFSFVMTYLLAGAILFQLPILMLTLNSVRPLTPKKLMTYQRHMIVGSLIFAAVISPTPDVMNQLLLASPLVLMYQFGIGLVWITNRRQAHKPIGLMFYIHRSQFMSLSSIGYPNQSNSKLIHQDER
jgi:sec-independent protein translocase protein TatC